MVIPMERVKPLMQKLSNSAFAGRKTAVQHVAVEEVLDKSPRHTARGEKGDGDRWILGRKRDRQHENRVQAIEGRQGVEATPSESGLLPLVGREGNFSGPLHWRRNKRGF